MEDIPSGGLEVHIRDAFHACGQSNTLASRRLSAAIWDSVSLESRRLEAGPSTFGYDTCEWDPFARLQTRIKAG